MPSTRALVAKNLLDTLPRPFSAALFATHNLGRFDRSVTEVTV